MLCNIGFGLHLRNTELVESLLLSGKQACSLPQRKTLSLKVAGCKYIPEREAGCRALMVLHYRYTQQERVV